MKDAAITLLGVVIIALVIVGPLLTIWALNTLFPALAIPYGFDTWAAVAIVHSVLHTKVSKT